MALNAIASHVLIRGIDGGAVDGTSTGNTGNAVSLKALARNIEKEDSLMAEIETGGIGDATGLFQPGRLVTRANFDLLTPIAGPILITVGNYFYFEFAIHTALTPAAGNYLVTRCSFRASDNQETIHSVSIIGPAAV